MYFYFDSRCSRFVFRCPGKACDYRSMSMLNGTFRLTQDPRYRIWCGCTGVRDIGKHIRIRDSLSRLYHWVGSKGFSVAVYELTCGGSALHLRMGRSCSCKSPQQGDAGWSGKDGVWGMTRFDMSVSYVASSVLFLVVLGTKMRHGRKDTTSRYESPWQLQS